MANERILSADSHVRISDEAVLGHLPQKYHDDYKQALLEYMARIAKKAKRKPAAQHA